MSCSRSVPSSATSRTCSSLWSMSRHSRVESASGGATAPGLCRPGCGREVILPLSGAGLVASAAARSGQGHRDPAADGADGVGAALPSTILPNGAAEWWWGGTNGAQPAGDPARRTSPVEPCHHDRDKRIDLGTLALRTALLALGTGLACTRAGTSVGSGPCGCRPGGGGAFQSPSASTPSVACGDDDCTLLQSFAAQHQGICGDGGGWLL